MNKEELIGKLQMVYVGDKNALNEMIDYYDELFGRLCQLEHNWNELKKYVQEQYLRADDESDYETAFLMIEDKMQELEEGGNNDC